MSDTLIVIPARYASTRFKGKPLAKIGGKELILRMCEIAASTGCEFVVATDNEVIRNCVGNADYPCVMTEGVFDTGTERVAAALEQYEKLRSKEFEYIINLQGDEPELQSGDIMQLIKSLREAPENIWTIICRYPAERGLEELQSPDLVKVSVDDSGEAVCFSRSLGNRNFETLTEEKPVYTHVGIYGFNRFNLMKAVEKTYCEAEKVENLEQMRWLQMNIPIKTVTIQRFIKGINRKEDIKEN